MKCGMGPEVRDLEEVSINLDPIQAGGRLTADAMKAVIAYGDGYSVCDHCVRPNRLDYIKKPGIEQFHKDLAGFIGMDQVRVVPGARRGFQAVARTYICKGDPVLVTSLSHYTEFLAIEESGGIPFEVQAGEDRIVSADAVAETIEEVIRREGRNPQLFFLDHVDYQFGNFHPVRDLIKVAHTYDIPVLYNGAYTVGIIPVNGRDIGADFVVGSGHKSMAAPAPSGVLGTTSERSDEVFRTTKVRGDRTGRTFGIKEVEMMGCTLMGVTLIGMMASFPHVKERVRHWDRELSNAEMILGSLLSIEGTEVLSEYPRRHTLTRVDTTKSFDVVAKKHKKKGFFFTSSLKEKGITGIIQGATRVWKYNPYGITREQAQYVALSFREIAQENGLNTI